MSGALSTEVLGRSEDGYTAALRAQGYSLARAIFKTPGQIGGVNPTIVDKIASLQTQIDELFQQLDNLETYTDQQVERLDNRINGLS